MDSLLVPAKKLYTPRRRGMFLGDIHFPFHHKIILPIAVYLTIKGQYDYIVQVGDLFDWYSAAKFPRSYNVFTPKHEKQWSRYYAELLWGILNEHCPRAEKYQLLGNHCVRPHKRIIETAPEFEEDMISSLNEHYTFDNVKTIYDSREELYLDDICAMHGYYSGAGSKHAAFNLKNFVGGHTHTGGTWFIRNEGHNGGVLFEANAGYLADPFSKGLGYTLQKRATKWTWGVLPIDQWGPKFIPLHPSMAERFRGDPIFLDLLKAFG